ncbi:hypothetical protein [Streptomyces sp. NPDC058240]|uniref:hypothetical protein n=1 Tax=Streptomyces sp. NPDC058240 TaxID=3346396 RepID=UPI0036F1359F
MCETRRRRGTAAAAIIGKGARSVVTWRRAQMVLLRYFSLRYFSLDGMDHADHKEQGSMSRHYLIWRRHTGLVTSGVGSGVDGTVFERGHAPGGD